MCSCCNANYYGESGRHFFARASEHLGMTPLTGKRVTNPKKSAIIDHILLKGYHTNFKDFKRFSWKIVINLNYTEKNLFW